MADYLKHGYIWLRGWLFYVLPALSNLILVLLGVIMSLPKLAEAVENNPKHRQRLAAICLLAGLIGFGFDVGQRRSGDVQTRTLVKNVGTLVNNTDTLISNTNILVGTTNSTVVSVGLLLPQINTLNAHVAEFDRKIAAAKGNPQLIAVLEGQATAAQKRADVISRQLLLAIAPGIYEGMAEIAHQWGLQSAGLSDSYMRKADAIGATLGPSERDKVLKEMGDKRSQLDYTYLQQSRTLFVTADNVRQQLLEVLHSGQTEEDEKEATVFAESAQEGPHSYSTVAEAARYLRSLTKRVSDSQRSTDTTSIVPSNISAVPSNAQ